MNKKDIDPIEVYTPKQVAGTLKINASTLRKYSNLVSKEYGSDFFKRDGSNARLYSNSDVQLLKRIIEIKKAPSITLDKAVKLALNEVSLNENKAIETPTDTANDSDYHGDMLPIQEFKNFMTDYHGDMAKLMKANHDLMTANKELNEKVTLLLNEMNNPQKTTWISKLFNKK